MEIVVSPEANDYITQHGGTVYVSLHAYRCCKNAVTLLDTTTSKPSELIESVTCLVDGIAVELLGVATPPDLLEIELRGRFRQRPVAFWNGCAFRN